MRHNSNSIRVFWSSFFCTFKTLYSDVGVKKLKKKKKNSAQLPNLHDLFERTPQMDSLLNGNSTNRKRKIKKKKSLIANGSLNQKHKPKKITEIHTNN